MTPTQVVEAEQVAKEAIIGEPKDLYVKDDVLFCPAELYLKNKWVQALLPQLESGSSRIGASVGGGVYEPSEVTKSKHGEKVYDHAILTHIAICDIQDAKNSETAVTLIKSHIGAMLNAEETPAASIEASGEMPTIQEIIYGYLGNQEDFLRYAFDVLKSHVTGGATPNHAHCRELFKGLGLEDGAADEFATELIVKTRTGAR
jgi:hypothetical protein